MSSGGRILHGPTRCWQLLLLCIVLCTLELTVVGAAGHKRWPRSNTTSPSASPSEEVSLSETPSGSSTPTTTTSMSGTVSASASVSASATVTSTVTPPPTPTPSASASMTATMSFSTSTSISFSRTRSVRARRKRTRTHTASATRTASASSSLPSRTKAATRSATRSRTPLPGTPGPPVYDVPLEPTVRNANVAAGVGAGLGVGVVLIFLAIVHCYSRRHAPSLSIRSSYAQAAAAAEQARSSQPQPDAAGGRPPSRGESLGGGGRPGSRPGSAQRHDGRGTDEDAAAPGATESQGLAPSVDGSGAPRRLYGPVGATPTREAAFRPDPDGDFQSRDAAQTRSGGEPRSNPGPVGPSIGSTLPAEAPRGQQPQYQRGAFDGGDVELTPAPRTPPRGSAPCAPPFAQSPMGPNSASRLLNSASRYDAFDPRYSGDG